MNKKSGKSKKKNKRKAITAIPGYEIDSHWTNSLDEGFVAFRFVLLASEHWWWYVSVFRGWWPLRFLIGWRHHTSREHLQSFLSLFLCKSPYHGMVLIAESGTAMGQVNCIPWTFCEWSRVQISVEPNFFLRRFPPGVSTPAVTSWRLCSPNSSNRNL